MNFQFRIKNNDEIENNESENENKENISKQRPYESKATPASVNSTKDMSQIINVTKIFVKKHPIKEKVKDSSHSSPFNVNVHFNHFPLSNKQIPFEYVQDIWAELNSELIANYDSYSYECIMAQSDINAQMRSVLIDWIQSVHSHFRMKEETLFLCINILDRFISKKCVVKEKLQLVGVSSFFLASKYEEIYFPNAAFLSSATNNAFSPKEIVEYEAIILMTLNFSLTRPLPTDFYSIIGFKFSMTKTEYYFGLFLLELFLLDINYTKYSSLILARSAAYLSLKNYRRNDSSIMLKSSESEIKLCSNEIIAWAKDIGDYSYRVILVKFLQEKFMKISELYLEKGKKHSS